MRSNAERDHALDVVKGLCVLVMVIHHALNYYPTELVSLRYFRFVSGAFVFLAGWVAVQIYGEKQRGGESGFKLGLRLVFRGFRLLALYAALNLALELGVGSASGRPATWGDFLRALFIDGDYRDVYFSLLLPISYVLVTMGFLMLLPKGRTVALFVLNAGCLVWSLALHGDQTSGYFLRYFTIGLIGALVGLIPAPMIRAACGNVVACCLGYACWLFVSRFLAPGFYAYVLSVVFSLGFLYSIAIGAPRNEPAAKWMVLWGKYTLIGYLGQIAILFATRMVLPRLALGDFTVVFAILITTGVLAVGIFALDRLRKSAPAVNTAYKVVFA